MSINKAIQERDNGALFIVSHSGGKDSQAMLCLLRTIIPDNQLFVIHAHLPGVEWDGVVEHIQDTIGDLDFEVCQARKTFLEMVTTRKMWPSAQYRQCTSDLKRGPIEKVVRRVLKERGLNRVVNCMGLRAQESPARAKKEPWKFSKRNSKAGRIWHDWLPIHSFTIEQVFETIKNNKQNPHWAYAKGMSRLSCCFCILASKSDLRTAAKLKPELANKMIKIEKDIGHTFRNGESLESIVRGK